MIQTNLALPLAEKTNIKNWAFEQLVLKDVPAPKEGTTYEISNEAQNAVVLLDGHIVFEKIAQKNDIHITQTTQAANEKNKLIALNNTHKNSSLSIHVGKNIKTTLYILYIAQNRSLLHQTQITLDSGADIDLIEKFETNTNHGINIVNRVALGANSHLRSSVIDRLFGGGVVYYTRQTDLQADSRFECTNFLLNDSNTVFEDFAHLLGSGSEANMATVAIADKDQKINITIRTENLAPHATAKITNYGVVKDSAHLAFNGIGKIHKGMNGGDNQQESRLLNLSKTAQAIANPFLLIDEGDITAGHAASIGQIDPEQVYYLMSRGMSKKDSEKLIVSGFLTPLANTITNENLKQELLNSIEEKLG